MCAAMENAALECCQHAQAADSNMEHDTICWQISLKLTDDMKSKLAWTRFSLLICILHPAVVWKHHNSCKGLAKAVRDEACQI